MHICHVITRLIIGGAQENTILSCEGLRARGHEVTLISGPTGGPEGSLVNRARRGGYRYIECPPLVRNINPWCEWQALVDLSKLFRDLRPDVVHTHSSKAGILGRIAARRAAAACVVHTIHGMSFNRTQSAPVRMLYRALERRCARMTDQFVSVSNAMTEQAVAAGLAPRERFSTIYSGMETDAFDPARYDAVPARREWGFEPRHVVVATVARLFRNKGYEELIPAMAAAAARDPALRFVWIGDGAQRVEYVSRLERLGIRNRVHLTGLVTPDRIPGLLAGADLLVHASRWEGLPRAVVQALLMCRPVVSFDIDGAPEVVRNGETGLLASLGDTSGLADAIVSLAADGPRRAAMGERGRATCLPLFDHRRMVEALEQLYQSAALAAAHKA